VAHGTIKLFSSANRRNALTHDDPPGQGAYFAKDETHAKGSDVGMTVIMIQVMELQPASVTDRSPEL